jgi:UDP-glucose 4-epimerase
MKPKVLITGASGFVGFHLIEAALKKDMDVYAAVRKSSDIKHLQSHPVSYTYLNYNDVGALAAQIEEKQYDYIIHAAGATKARTQQEYDLVNVTYTINLARAIEQSAHLVKKVVVLSSLASIGPITDPSAFIEDNTTTHPVTGYGKSKLLAEEQLAKFGFPLVVLRPTAVYGPRDKDIFIILKTFTKGFEPYIGRTTQRLSFVYVKDLASVAINSVFVKATGSYNITDGNCYSRYEMANITKEFLGKKTIKIHLPITLVKGLAITLEKSYSLLNKTSVLNLEKLNELTAINWCCNIERAKKELGFEPAYDLRSGLKEALNWYRENNWI